MVMFGNHSSENISQLINASESFNSALFEYDALEYYELLAFHVSLYKITVPVLFGGIMAIGLLGNFMVIYVIIFKSIMRTTVNLLLLNLALCDIIFLSICMPFVMYHYVADTWMIGDVSCKVSQFLIYTTVYVTVYTLVAISMVRYIIIVCPKYCAILQNKWNILLLIGVIWFVQIVVNTPILFIYKVKAYPLEGSNPYLYCAMENKITGQRLFISFFSLSYVVPLCLICTFYMMLLHYLRQKGQNSSLRRLSKRTPGQDRASFASRILIVVVTVFGLCWLPLHVHLLIVYFGTQPQSSTYEVFRVMAHGLAYSNTCMNPIIYSCVSADFRKCFAGVWISCFKRCKRPVYNSPREMNVLIKTGHLTTQSCYESTTRETNVVNTCMDNVSPNKHRQNI